VVEVAVVFWGVMVIFVDLYEDHAFISKQIVFMFYFFSLHCRVQLKVMFLIASTALFYKEKNIK